jgi:hypothetical protein
MSIHAELSPEALARLQAQKRNSTISSIVISALVIVLIALILGVFLLPQISKDTPTIVTYQATVADESQMEQKKMNTTIQRKPSAPTSAMAKVIAANTASPTAIPVPDIDIVTPSTEFGDGESFGGGWGDEDAGMGGGFGNIPATMRKRCSPEDRLLRLKETGGTPACEEAVTKGLQWLKKTQQTNGSWTGMGNYDPAMTGLALLAYLGRCETPLSEEFGESCLRAITYLVNVGMKNNGRLTNNPVGNGWVYEHAIASYALAEASTFCKQLNINVPNLFEVTQKANQLIIDNQHSNGGWSYEYRTTNPHTDLSITAWHTQALKAAQHTGLEFRGLSRAADKAIAYTENLQNSNGGFGYTSKDRPSGNKPYFSLTGAGVLSLQLFDKGERAAARNGARYIENNTKFNYNGEESDLYAHYYEAQAMMNRGGEQWKKYNALFRDQLLANQAPDGSWKPPGANHHGTNNLHYRTCLAILMLEVYYRFLPGTGASVK